MTRGVRLTVGVVIAAFVVLIIGVPLSLYQQNQSAIRRNTSLIARVANDEAATKTLAVAQAQSLCLSGNDYRMQDSELWHFILNAFPSPPVGSVERTRLDQFLAFLAVHDKQRDCTKL